MLFNIKSHLVLFLLLGYSCLICSNGCVSAQTSSGSSVSSSGKFDDKDVNNFIPVFSPNMDDVPKVDFKSGKLPDKNSAQRVSDLMDWTFESNKKLKYMEGYRVLVYFGNDMNEANKVREKIYKLVPDTEDIHPEYKQPDYRVKLGDYASRLEANRVLSSLILKSFPNAIVVSDKILIKRKY